MNNYIPNVLEKLEFNPMFNRAVDLNSNKNMRVVLGTHGFDNDRDSARKVILYVVNFRKFENRLVDKFYSSERKADEIHLEDHHQPRPKAPLSLVKVTRGK